MKQTFLLLNQTFLPKDHPNYNTPFRPRRERQSLYFVLAKINTSEYILAAQYPDGNGHYDVATNANLDDDTIIGGGFIDFTLIENKVTKIKIWGNSTRYGEADNSIVRDILQTHYGDSMPIEMEYRPKLVPKKKSFFKRIFG